MNGTRPAKNNLAQARQCLELIRDIADKGLGSHDPMIAGYALQELSQVLVERTGTEDRLFEPVSAEQLKTIRLLQQTPIGSIQGWPGHLSPRRYVSFRSSPTQGARCFRGRCARRSGSCMGPRCGTGSPHRTHAGSTCDTHGFLRLSHRTAIGLLRRFDHVMEPPSRLPGSKLSAIIRRC
jgi:hypothetical protein